jgi:hypothetical protein
MSTSSNSRRAARAVGIVANTLSANLFGARARNFNTRSMSTTTTTTFTSTPRLLYHRSYTTSTTTSSPHKHPSHPTQLTRSQSTNLPSNSNSPSNVFTSPFWSLDHCAHCYPNDPSDPQHPVDSSNDKNEASLQGSALKEDLKRISEETIRSTKFTSGNSHSNKAGSGSGSNLPRGEPPGSFSSHLLSHPHTHPHTHVYGQGPQPSHLNMSTSASTSTPTPNPSTTTTPSAPKPTTKAIPKPGQGILVPASKVHTTVKSELLQTLSSSEFNPELDIDGRRGRGVKLVGILATGMEDAANYAEVSGGGLSLSPVFFLREMGMVGWVEAGKGKLMVCS